MHHRLILGVLLVLLLLLPPILTSRAKSRRICTLCYGDGKQRRYANGEAANCVLCAGRGWIE